MYVRMYVHTYAHTQMVKTSYGLILLAMHMFYVCTFTPNLNYVHTYARMYVHTLHLMYTNVLETQDVLQRRKTRCTPERCHTQTELLYLCVHTGVHTQYGTCLPNIRLLVYPRVDLSGRTPGYRQMAVWWGGTRSSS